MSALRDSAVSSSKLPVDAGPHPLKAMLHDLCRQIVRETSSITTNHLAELLADEDNVRELAATIQVERARGRAPDHCGCQRRARCCC